MASETIMLTRGGIKKNNAHIKCIIVDAHDFLRTLVHIVTSGVYFQCTHVHVFRP